MMKFIAVLLGLLLAISGIILLVYVVLTYVPIPLPQISPTPTEAVTTVKMFVRGSQVKKDIPVKEAGWSNARTVLGTAAEWDIPYDAAGHLMTTPQPGQVGNAVFSGHHNLIGPNHYGVGLFAYFWNLRAGDKIYFSDDHGHAYEYVVTASYSLLEEGRPLAVREQHAAQIMAQGNEPTVTLITCWAGAQNPLASNTYRWIVTAKLVEQVDVNSIPAVQ